MSHQAGRSRRLGIPRRSSSGPIDRSGTVVSALRTPQKGEYVCNEPLIESTDERIIAEARRQTASLGDGASQIDTAQALYRFVEQKIRNDVRLEGAAVSAATCLEPAVAIAVPAVAFWSRFSAIATFRVSSAACR